MRESKSESVVFLVDDAVGKEGEDAVEGEVVLADEDQLVARVKGEIGTDGLTADVVSADDGNDGGFGVVPEVDFADGLSVDPGALRDFGFGELDGFGGLIGEGILHIIDGSDDFGLEFLLLIEELLEGGVLVLDLSLGLPLVGEFLSVENGIDEDADASLGRDDLVLFEDVQGLADGFRGNTIGSTKDGATLEESSFGILTREDFTANVLSNLDVARSGSFFCHK